MLGSLQGIGLGRRPPWLLALTAAAAFVFGLWARAHYGLTLHHPRNNVVGDAITLVEFGRRLLESPLNQAANETIWPPGTASLLAVYMSADATLMAPALPLFVAACITPVLVGLTAHLVSGLRAGLWASIIASLHFGFMHYVGFFLSEQLFQTSVALAVWVSVAGLKLAEAGDDTAPRAWLRHAGLGAAGGIAWGLSAAFRPNSLPIAIATGAALGVYWLVEGQRGKLVILAGATFGLLLVIAPLAHRCTLINPEGFCPVSSNFAMNVVLGQAGELLGYKFVSSKHPGESSLWYPPSLGAHGYTGTGEIHASIYESRALLKWVLDRFLHDPAGFMLRAVGNGLDLFRLDYWPDGFLPLHERLVTVNKQLVLFGVVLPGVVAWGTTARRVLKRRVSSAIPVFLVAVVASLFVLAMASMGEARYRLPFDCVFIVLAVAMFTRVGPARSAHVGPGTLAVTRVLLVPTTLAALVIAALVIAVSHPWIAIGASVLRRFAQLPDDRRIEARPVSRFSEPRADGDAYDDKGNFIFKCKPSCPELRLEFDKPVNGRNLEVSLDHNDRYRVLFYFGSRTLGFKDVGRGDEIGLHNYMVKVPFAPRGFDAVGVVPLYGDGNYALGHVRVVP